MTRVITSSIVEIHEDHIKCLLCGKEMLQVGSHFKARHNFPVRSRMPHSERLALYGLPKGTRLAVRSLRKKMSDSSIKRNAGSILKPYALPKGTQLGREQNKYGCRPASPAALAVLDALRGTPRHGAAVKKLIAKRIAKCEGCGEQFTHLAHQQRRYCSRKCANDHIQPGLSAPVVRARAVETFKRTRQEHPWSTRPPEKWRTIKTCEACGGTFSVINSKANKKFCSQQCYFAKRRMSGEDADRLPMRDHIGDTHDMVK